MSTHPREIAPFNWQALVAEAIRRRKAESMTQREHAALASVSIPTIVAFDRGESTLTLVKAFDILRVVGLLDEPSEKGAQETFVQDAFRRWRDLTTQLPENSPGRFPDGWYRIDYALDGELKDIELHQFTDVLKASVVRHTGWPLFLYMARPEFKPKEVDGVIESWIKPADAGVDRAHTDPAHCDFWRATPTGRMFTIRGYQEDSQETFPPRTIFDTTLPTWRLGEALLHAENLANKLAIHPKKTNVRLRALYTGLSGRVLRAWGNPMADLMFEGGAARSDEAVLETTVAVKDIKLGLAQHLHPLIASLFERFGIAGVTVDRLQAELDRMMQNNFSPARN